jgi:hypothetical protein
MKLKIKFNWEKKKNKINRNQKNEDQIEHEKK